MSAAKSLSASAAAGSFAARVAARSSAAIFRIAGRSSAPGSAPSANWAAFLRAASASSPKPDSSRSLASSN